MRSLACKVVKPDIDDIQIRPSVGVKIDGKRMFIQENNKAVKKQCITLCSFIDIPLNCVQLIVHKLCNRLGPVNFQSADQDN